MKSVLAFALMMTLTSPVLAQTRATPLRDAVRRTQPPTVRIPAAPPPRVAQSHDSWPARHSVLLGALAGFAVGAPIGYATCKYPGSEGPCSYYTYPGRARAAATWTMGALGAGIGAGVGALIGAVR